MGPPAGPAPGLRARWQDLWTGRTKMNLRPAHLRGPGDKQNPDTRICEQVCCESELGAIALWTWTPERPTEGDGNQGQEELGAKTPAGRPGQVVRAG